jgi:hypothetical protein
VGAAVGAAVVGLEIVGKSHVGDCRCEWRNSAGSKRHHTVSYSFAV